MIGVCRVCGCTDERACDGGCSWVYADLCSACVWEPLQDDDLSTDAVTLLDVVSAAARDTSAGVCTMQLRADDDRLLAFGSVAHIRDLHVGLFFDATSGDVLWAKRPVVR